jgi:LacI family transcriptional regulator
MVTIRDIAERVGVSISTVGRALADDRRISAETKARVRAVADELGYVVHTAARVMRGQTSSLVGLVVPDVQNHFYSTVAKAISECCQEYGFQLVLSITDDDPAAELQHVRGLCSARAVGVVMIATASPLRETVSLLERIPHVQLIRKSPQLRSDWFGIDDVAAMAEAVRHLVELGHRRIGYVGGSTAHSTGAERLGGFRRALADAGLEPAATETGGCDTDYGRGAMERVLARKPTAVVMGGARLTLGALECLAARRVRVPQDLSFIGFSDSPAFGWLGPGLTTIGLPIREIAPSCSSFLLRRVRGQAGTGGPAQPYRAMHSTFLIKRGTTAPPSTARRAA